MHTAEFKAKVGLEAVRGGKTVTELAQEYGVHPVLVGQWKKEILENAGALFDVRRGPKPVDESSPEDKLYSEIGKLKMQVNWLKKSLVNEPGRTGALDRAGGRHAADDAMRAGGGAVLTVYRRLEAAARPECLDEEDGRLCALIDEEYTHRPFYGSRRMAVFLRRRGHRVNRKRVQRLMREMGMAPGPATSKPHPRHKVYSYRLRGVAVIRPNQVRSTDLTYVQAGAAGAGLALRVGVRIGFDAGDRQPELPRAHGGDVAAGTGADDGHIKLIVHVVVSKSGGRRFLLFLLRRLARCRRCARALFLGRPRNQPIHHLEGRPMQHRLRLISHAGADYRRRRQVTAVHRDQRHAIDPVSILQLRRTARLGLDTK